MKKENKVLTFLGVLFSIIFSLFLSVSIIILVLLLFLNAINENVTLPDAFFFSGSSLDSFLGSPYSYVLNGALILIPVLLIILLNIRRARRIFLALAYSSCISIILLITSAIISPHVLNLLSGEWQNVLINTTVVFRDFCIICAIILFVIVVTCLSIYFCISAVKGGRHEKNS